MLDARFRFTLIISFLLIYSLFRLTIVWKRIDAKSGERKGINLNATVAVTVAVAVVATARKTTNKKTKTN